MALNDNIQCEVILLKNLLFTFIIDYFISLTLTVTAGPGSHPGEFKDTEFNIGGISFGSPMEYVIEIMANLRRKKSISRKIQLY